MAQINQSWTETGPRQETETEENWGTETKAVGNSGRETGESENSEESAQTEHSSCRAVHYTLAQSLKILLPNTWKPFS